MKEKDKLNTLKFLKQHIYYVDGFWILNGELASEFAVRCWIHTQLDCLEKDVTDFLSELSFNKMIFDIDYYFKHKIKSQAKNDKKSKYLSSLDKLYPHNKFREILNYYLFNDDCYAFILVGYGQTGKSTFVNLLAKILGQSFFGRSNVNLLRNVHGTAVLEGKKIFEVAEGQDLDLDTANLLKSIITCDPVYVNPKFQLPRTIIPHAKLLMTCNQVPRFRVTDDGIIRRFIIVNMNEKIEKQNKNFLNEIEDDIPYIINEALEHPFNIEDFAEEQYLFFLNDPQYGFGFGTKTKDYIGENEYEKYQSMCKALGFKPRNKLNFDKFIELEKIYKKRLKGCDTILGVATQESGLTPLNDLELENLPFDV